NSEAGLRASTAYAGTDALIRPIERQFDSASVWFTYFVSDKFAGPRGLAICLILDAAPDRRAVGIRRCGGRFPACAGSRLRRASACLLSPSSACALGSAAPVS